VKTFRPLMTLAAVCTLWGSPQAPGTAALSTAAVIEAGADEDVEGVGPVRRLPEISPSSLRGFETSSDGNRFLVLRIGMGNLQCARLYIRNMALPPDATLFVYGLDANGSVTTVSGPFKGVGPLNSGEFWSDPLTGSEIVVELQATEVLPDLPFEMVGIAASDISEAVLTIPRRGPDPRRKERQSSLRG
jgi:hypothetical protein